MPQELVTVDDVVQVQSQQYQGRVAQPIPLTQLSQNLPNGLRMGPEWTAKREKEERIHRLAAHIAQGLVSANGANLPSATLVSKTMELTNALFQEIERKLSTL